MIKTQRQNPLQGFITSKQLIEKINHDKFQENLRSSHASCSNATN